MEGIYSSRELEKACKRDLNFRWLPEHNIIARFKTERLSNCLEEKIKTYKLESGKEKENIEAENKLRNQLRELTIRLNNNGFNSIKDFER